MALSRKARAQLESTSKKARTEAPATESPAAIQVGDTLPDLDLTLQNEEVVNLSQKYATQAVAIFAYPKASTPGCTKQTSGFGQLYPEFQKLGVAVFGLSADTPRAQSTFKSKTEVDFDLISDPKYELIGPLGAKKSPKGVIRSHWLFVNGKAVLVEHSVKPDESPKAVLAAAKQYVSAAPATDEQPEDTKTANLEDETEKTDAKDESKDELKEESVTEAKDTHESSETPAGEAADAPEKTPDVSEEPAPKQANGDKDSAPVEPEPENADGDETQVEN